MKIRLTHDRGDIFVYIKFHAAIRPFTKEANIIDEDHRIWENIELTWDTFSDRYLPAKSSR